MSDPAKHQAAFRARRKTEGARKLSFYLSVEEAELLKKRKARHKTDRASVVAALRIAASAQVDRLRRGGVRSPARRVTNEEIDQSIRDHGHLSEFVRNSTPAFRRDHFMAFKLLEKIHPELQRLINLARELVSLHSPRPDLEA